MQENELNILDVIAEIFLRWKRLVLSILICGVVFAGVKYMQEARGVNASFSEETDAAANAVKEIEQKWTEDSLLWTQTAKASVLRAADNTRESSAYNSYLNDSVLMNINPDYEAITTLVFCVSAGSDSENQEVKSREEVACVYREMLQNGNLQNTLADHFSMDARFVQELVQVMADSSVIRITVIGSDTSVTSSMGDDIVAYVSNLSPVEDTSMKAYKLSLLDKSTVYRIDQDLREKQNQIHDKVDALRIEWAELIDGGPWTLRQYEFFSFLLNGGTEYEFEQKLLEDYQNELDLAAATVAPAPIQEVEAHFQWKWFVVGGLAGILLHSMVVLFTMVFWGTIRITDHPEERFGVRQLGVLRDERERKSHYRKFFSKLRGMSSAQISRADAEKIAESRILTLAQKEGAGTVSLVGEGVLEREMAPICLALREAGLETVICTDILMRPEELQKAKATSASVLIVKAGVSTYETIRRELEIMQEASHSILGMLVIE